MHEKPKVAAELRTMQILLLGILLLLPWSGLWRVEHTSDAIRYSIFNAALLPFMSLVVVAVSALVVVPIARRLGDDVMTVQLGFGPRLMQLRVRRVHLAWHVFSGLTIYSVLSPNARRQRLRSAIALLGGALVLGLPAAALHAYFGSDTLMRELTKRIAPDVLLVEVAAVLGFFQLVLALMSGANPEVLRTLRRLYWINIALRHTEVGAFEQAASAAQRGLEESPDDMLLQLNLATARSAQSHVQAFDLAKQLRDRELPPNLQPAANNLWAWECYVRGDLAFGRDADEASRNALAQSPDEPSFLDTRGHVLVWLGRASEGEPMLRRAYDKAPRESTRGHAAAGLAMAYASMNRIDDAVGWLARAKQHGCAQRLLAKATAIVAPLQRS